MIGQALIAVILTPPLASPDAVSVFLIECAVLRDLKIFSECYWLLT